MDGLWKLHVVRPETSEGRARAAVDDVQDDRYATDLRAGACAERRELEIADEELYGPD